MTAMASSKAAFDSRQAFSSARWKASDPNGSVPLRFHQKGTRHQFFHGCHGKGPVPSVLRPPAEWRGIVAKNTESFGKMGLVV